MVRVSKQTRSGCECRAWLMMPEGKGMNSDFNPPTHLLEVVEGAMKARMKSRNRVKGDRFTFVPQSFTPYAVFPHCDLIYQDTPLSIFRECSSSSLQLRISDLPARSEQRRAIWPVCTRNRNCICLPDESGGRRSSASQAALPG